MTDIRRYIDFIESLNESASSLDPFKTMSREQFIGDPRITTNGNAATLKPKVLTTLKDASKLPFMNDLTAVYNEDGAAVFDGDEVIASYNFGDTLVVDKDYRRRGIGEELVYQWRTRFPNIAPAKTRTKSSHALQAKVWDRIQRELKYL